MVRSRFCARFARAAARTDDGTANVSTAGTTAALACAGFTRRARIAGLDHDTDARLAARSAGWRHHHHARDNRCGAAIGTHHAPARMAGTAEGPPLSACGTGARARGR